MKKKPFLSLSVSIMDYFVCENNVIWLPIVLVSHFLFKGSQPVFSSLISFVCTTVCDAFPLVVCHSERFFLCKLYYNTFINQ